MTVYVRRSGYIHPPGDPGSPAIAMTPLAETHRVIKGVQPQGSRGSKMPKRNQTRRAEQDFSHLPSVATTTPEADDVALSWDEAMQAAVAPTQHPAKSRSGLPAKSVALSWDEAMQAAAPTQDLAPRGSAMGGAGIGFSVLRMSVRGQR